MIKYLLEGVLSQERRPDSQLIKQIREVDPDADLIHLSKDRWALVSMTATAEEIVAGRKNLLATLDAIRAVEFRTTHLPPEKKSVLRTELKDRYASAVIKAYGGKIVSIIESREPNSSVARGYQIGEWFRQHQSYQDFMDNVVDGEQNRRREAAIGELTDRERAYSVWKYQNTLNHAPGIFNTPVQPVGSGRTRHLTIN